MKEVDCTKTAQLCIAADVSSAACAAQGMQTADMSLDSA